MYIPKQLMAVPRPPPIPSMVSAAVTVIVVVAVAVQHLASFCVRS